MMLDVAAVAALVQCTPRQAVKFIREASGPDALSTTDEAIGALFEAKANEALAARQADELWPEDLVKLLKCTRKQAIGVIAIAGNHQRGDAARKNPLLRGELDAWLKKDLSTGFRHSRDVSRWETSVYFVANKSAVKIGYTRNIDQRLAQLRMHSPTPVHAVALLRGGQQLESALHARFGEYRIHGEWFRNTGSLARLLERAP